MSLGTVSRFLVCRVVVRFNFCLENEDMQFFVAFFLRVLRGRGLSWESLGGNDVSWWALRGRWLRGGRASLQGLYEFSGRLKEHVELPSHDLVCLGSVLGEPLIDLIVARLALDQGLHCAGDGLVLVKLLRHNDL